MQMQFASESEYIEKPHKSFESQDVGYDYLDFVQFLDTTSKLSTLKPNSTALTNGGSSSPPPQPNQIPYCIITKWQTPVEAFNKFIKELDGGKGRADRGPYDQLYSTPLTPTQADGTKPKYPFVLLVYADVLSAEELEGIEDELEPFGRKTTA